MSTGRSLNDKVVVIAGGSGLIGTRFVRLVAEEGGNAVIASRSEEQARGVIDDVIREGFEGSARFVAGDLTSAKDVSRLFERVHKQYGRIDAVVNNLLPRSGTFGRSFEVVEYEDFCKGVQDHVGSYFLLCQNALKYFSTQGYGNIINIGSVYGTIPPKFELYEDTHLTKEIDYVVAKASIVAMTRYIAAYSKSKNIRVNCLSPGGVVDHQPPEFLARYNKRCLNKGMLSPDDLAGALKFLISEDALFVNGQNLIVDDGFHLS